MKDKSTSGVNEIKAKQVNEAWRLPKGNEIETDREMTDEKNEETKKDLSMTTSVFWYKC